MKLTKSYYTQQERRYIVCGIESSMKIQIVPKDDTIEIEHSDRILDLVGILSYPHSSQSLSNRLLRRTKGEKRQGMLSRNHTD